MYTRRLWIRGSASRTHAVSSVHRRRTKMYVQEKHRCDLPRPWRTAFTRKCSRSAQRSKSNRGQPSRTHGFRSLSLSAYEDSFPENAQTSRQTDPGGPPDRSKAGALHMARIDNGWRRCFAAAFFSFAFHSHAWIKREKTKATTSVNKWTDFCSKMK